MNYYDAIKKLDGDKELIALSLSGVPVYEILRRDLALGSLDFVKGQKEKVITRSQGIKKITAFLILPFIYLFARTKHARIGLGRGERGGMGPQKYDPMFQHIEMKEDECVFYNERFLILDRIFSTLIDSGIGGSIIPNFLPKKVLKKVSKRFGEYGFYLTERTIARKVLRFKLEVFKYKLILSAFHIKRLYLTAWYGKLALVKAANDKGVEVIDVQHSVISKQHIGYSYGFTPSILPSHCFLWERVWVDKISFPVVVSIRKKTEPGRVFTGADCGKTNTIKFYLNGQCDDVLVNLANEAVSLYHYNIVLRPHPMYIDSLMKYKPAPLVSVEEPSEVDISSSIMGLDVAVGYTTTCLYEALNLGKPILAFENTKSLGFHESIPAEFLFSSSLEFHDKLQSLKDLESIALNCRGSFA